MPPKINLMGQRFGHLTVVSPAESIGGRVAWRCQCDCGGEVVTTRNSLRSGETQTCGCGKGSKLDLTGQRFGRLVAIRMAGRSRKQDALRCSACHLTQRALDGDEAVLLAEVDRLRAVVEDHGREAIQYEADYDRLRADLQRIQRWATTTVHGSAAAEVLLLIRDLPADPTV